MIINKGGCDKHSPGIGDVAYVKNLLSDSIVTRNFRCSKFGLAHHPRTKFGWVRICILQLKRPVLINSVVISLNIYFYLLYFLLQYMMNSCLQKPCGYGFAYHPLIKQFKYQTDFSGAFRYCVGRETLEYVNLMAKKV